MKHILILILAFILSVPTCQKKVNTVIDEQRMVAVEDTLTRHQLDSLFIADTLSFDMEKDWIQSQVLSEDKKEFLYKYVYIKSLTDSTGTIYTFTYHFKDSEIQGTEVYESPKEVFLQTIPVSCNQSGYTTFLHSSFNCHLAELEGEYQDWRED